MYVLVITASRMNSVTTHEQASENDDIEDDNTCKAFTNAVGQERLS